jgi:hypothetical protein
MTDLTNELNTRTFKYFFKYLKNIKKTHLYTYIFFTVTFSLIIINLVILAIRFIIH